MMQIIPAPLALEGDGIAIHRAFPNTRLEEFDPFLLLDHLGPMDLKPGEAKGFPDHPHRGFETVTYLLQGEFQHRDSFGHKGVIKAGGVQWMTAGSGLVHSEVPAESLVKNGGMLEGFQLWVNLPKSRKMTAPRYQELSAANIPSVTSKDGLVTVKVIAGQSMGVKGGVETNIPIEYLHFMLKAGAKHVHEMAAGLNTMIYVMRGAVEIDGRSVREYHLAALDSGARQVAFAAHADAQFLLMSAQPLHEPVARYGPFVMNTREELQQAFADFQSGKMGTID